MSDILQRALNFLILAAFDLYIFILILRLILVWVRAEYFHVVTQFVVKVTDFIIKPLRKITPNIGKFETASFLVVFVLEISKFFLISLLAFGFPYLLGLVGLAFTDMLELTLQVFFYAILLQAILSWVQPWSPLNQLLIQLTAPIMWPLQRVVPLVGGMNISPIFALIGLQLLMIILINPLQQVSLAHIR